MSDNALSVAVARLRKTLERAPGGRQLVVTVHKQGYRLGCDVIEGPARTVSTIRHRRPCSAPFVGRETAVLSLRDNLALACEGTGGVALLTGPPGIGKTRLAEEFAREASAEGHAVAWGFWLEGGLPPLWPIAEALRDALDQLPPAIQSRPEIAELLPVLAQIHPEFSTGLHSTEPGEASHTPASPAAVPQVSKHAVGRRLPPTHPTPDEPYRRLAVGVLSTFLSLPTDQLRAVFDEASERWRFSCRPRSVGPRYRCRTNPS